VIRLDQRLDRWVVHHRIEPFDTVFVWLSRIGSYGLVWLALAALFALLWKRPTILALVLVADALAELISDVGKELTNRQRPAFRYPQPAPLMHIPHTHSFPSGHAATSFACAATLARFVPRRAAVLLFVLAAAIAWSRVYVGAHYPADVVVGAIVGVAVATALLPLRAVPPRLRRAPPAG
jgi:undecaprenyl-diphosphatase